MRSALLLVLVVACGGAASRPSLSDEGKGPGASRRDAERPEKFVSTEDPNAITSRFVRPERSSRLAMAMPSGKARALFKVELGKAIDPSYLLVASNRILVVGRGGFALFDTGGRFVNAEMARLAEAHVAVTPAAGTFTTLVSGTLTTWSLDKGSTEGAPDVGAQAPPTGARRGGTYVTIASGAVRVTDSGGERTIAEGKIEPLDVAIDDGGLAQIVVRQGKELSLWTAPLNGGSIGRTKLSSQSGDRLRAPPILGTQMRVVLFEDRIVGIARDGKVIFTRRGAPSGGATITADDKLLVADGAKVTATDAQGRSSDIVVEAGASFVTPPIVTTPSLLLVASATALYAYEL